MVSCCGSKIKKDIEYDECSHAIACISSFICYQLALKEVHCNINKSQTNTGSEIFHRLIRLNCLVTKSILLYTLYCIMTT